MDLRLEVPLTFMSRGPDHTILEIQLGLQCQVVLRTQVGSILSDRCLLEGIRRAAFQLAAMTKYHDSLQAGFCRRITQQMTPHANSYVCCHTEQVF